jgi:AcrR family transcriptional regulator
VARSAGCATSVLYHYFVSRAGLIDAAMMEAVMHLAPSISTSTSESVESARRARDLNEWLEIERQKASDPQRLKREALFLHVRGAASEGSIVDALAHIDALRDASRAKVMAILRERGFIRSDLDDIIVARALEGLGSRWRQAHFTDDEVLAFSRAMSPA